MALHKKHEKLLSFGADITVIQECSRKFIRQINRTEDGPPRGSEKI